MVSFLFFQNVLVCSKWTQHIKFFNEFHYILLNHLSLLEYNNIIVQPQMSFVSAYFHVEGCAKIPHMVEDDALHGIFHETAKENKGERIRFWRFWISSLCGHKACRGEFFAHDF